VLVLFLATAYALISFATIPLSLLIAIIALDRMAGR